MSTAIKIEHVSKQYRLGQIGTGTIRHDLNRWWQKMRGNDDPYLKIGDLNDRTIRGESEYVWALRDIDFNVKQGDVLGVIGRNGAGKSTLLKILSRTTAPTLGQVKIKGRVASLLEVGTGFHPELSGRDNIYLNGTILGMRRKEIDRKFDEIVDFSGVERYIDTPVKRYSSGMYVRLAFAVAAYLESEILIVDEVLAVGDAEFQKKCLGRMKDVSGAGRTVLFVSHNIGAIKSLCNTGLLLENGLTKAWGNIEEVIGSYYKKEDSLEGQFSSGKLHSDEKVYIKSVTIKNQHNQITESFNTGDDIIVEMKLISDDEIINPNISIAIKSRSDYLTTANTMLDGAIISKFIKGENMITLTFKNLPLFPQEYYLMAGVRASDCKTFLMISKEIGYFAVVTSMKDLGIEGPLIDELAMESVSPLISYEWDFGNGHKHAFNILNNVKR
jgi:lipopolysaccharide transport system ATP-binding protein